MVVVYPSEQYPHSWFLAAGELQSEGSGAVSAAVVDVAAAGPSEIVMVVATWLHSAVPFASWRCIDHAGWWATLANPHLLALLLLLQVLSSCVLLLHAPGRCCMLLLLLLLHSCL